MMRTCRADEPASTGQWGARHAAALTAIAALLALAGCAMLDFGPKAEVRDVAVDRQAALAAINAYRAGHGLPTLRLDPRLNDAARDMAHRIAEADSMGIRAHSSSGLAGRLDRAGYETYAGAENLGAGYASFDAALAGWKGSSEHNRNLLNKYVTRIGLARTERADGKWRNFWVLIFARPKEDGRPTL